MPSDRLPRCVLNLLIGMIPAWLLCAAPSARAQEAVTAPAGGTAVEARIDSGLLRHESADRNGVIFQSHVHDPGAAWIRLRFDDVQLAGEVSTDTNSILRLTSLLDGAVQELDAIELVQWGYSSAYLNGDAVLIEVVSRGASGINSLRMSEFTAGPDAGVPAEVQRSICGGTDDRELSDDPRVARLAPIGCTTWMIDDCNNCFLSAGHCIGSGSQVVQFNVPLSNPNGSWNNPHPDDQYPVDQTSIQSRWEGIGNDWAYFGAFPNSNTGLRPATAQGDVFEFVPPPVAVGQTVRVTGYGTVLAPVPGTWNSVQKTHDGPFTLSLGSRVGYAADTTGGNSGGPVILESTGKAIGIHTHGGCNGSGGANNGTSITQVSLQAALANPLGVCCAGEAEAPGSFLLTTPANGASSVDLNPTVQWEAAQNTWYYRIWIADNHEFDAPVVAGFTTSSTQIALPSGVLDEHTTYYWYVVAFSPTELERRSTPQVASFTTAASQTPCPGDVNGDQTVDLKDLNIILSNFGQPTQEGPPLGDLDLSGTVDLADLNMVLTNFGQQCS